mmetsp:Transcript_63883/g.152354  ORF Transcript_63883/g.152354 Transcript_63883/m.152354 type:complete len:447 (+) Transcript_63883:57-1397(+)
MGEVEKNASAPRCVVVYSHSWLPGQVDGVAVRMMAHVRELVKRGVKVVLLTPDFVCDDEPGPPPKLEAIPGVSEHIRLRTGWVPVYRKNKCLQCSIENLKTVCEVLRQAKPDYMHATQEASLQLICTATMLCKVPLVVSMHTDVVKIALTDAGFSSFLGSGAFGRIHTQIAILFVRFGYRNWDKSGSTFYCVSKQARQILHDAGVSDSSIAPGIWGPMVDRETFRIDLPEAKVEEKRKKLTFGIADAFLMVYVGRVTAEKDVQFLVDALDRAPANVVLAIIGPGSMVKDLKTRHGREHRLHCDGEFMGREEVALSMRAADLCVSASTMETIGFTAMEALSCGTPMLAVRAQGFAEHLTHGVNARLWTPHDTESFDQELAAIMRTERTGSWTREALRASMEEASVVACTDRVLEAYLHAKVPEWRLFHWIAAVFFFFLNWFCACFIR